MFKLVINLSNKKNHIFRDSKGLQLTSVERTPQNIAFHPYIAVHPHPHPPDEDL